MPEIELRDYQKKAIENVQKGLENGKNKQLIIMATGAGKTFTFSALINCLSYRKILFLAHREELLKQATKAFKTLNAAVPVYLERGQEKVNLERLREDSRAIVVASVQTLRTQQRRERFSPDDFDAVVTDETHHSPAATYQKIYAYFGFSDENSKKFMLGLTATPDRTDKRGLDEVYDEVAYVKGIRELIDEGYLVPVHCYRIETETNLDEIAIRAGDLQQDQLSKAISTVERNKAIVAGYKKHLEGKKTIVFCVTKKHMWTVQQAFFEEGILARTIHGDMTPQERKDTLQWLHETPDAVLLNCMILTEGFDEPTIEGVILARPTVSKALYQQCVGRGLRLARGKNKAVIVDVVDVSAKHTLETSSCIAGVPSKVKIIGNVMAQADRYRRAEVCAKRLKIKNYQNVETIEKLEEIVWSEFFKSVNSIKVDPFTTAGIGFSEGSHSKAARGEMRGIQLSSGDVTYQKDVTDSYAVFSGQGFTVAVLWDISGYLVMLRGLMFPVDTNCRTQEEVLQLVKENMIQNSTKFGINKEQLIVLKAFYRFIKDRFKQM